jgi:hypothetical protein
MNPAPDASTSYDLSSRYYLVREGVYYYSSNGDLEPLVSCPEREWVYNERGWSETNRTKSWRYREERHNSFKSDGFGAVDLDTSKEHA